MKPVGFLVPVIPVTLTLGLVGCAVGPDYHTPAPPATSGYVAGGLPAATPPAAGGRQHFISGADISGQWWALFQSPELNSLIDAALAQNPTLAAAQQTLIEAEENLRALREPPLADEVFEEIRRHHRWIRNFYHAKVL